MQVWSLNILQVQLSEKYKSVYISEYDTTSGEISHKSALQKNCVTCALQQQLLSHQQKMVVCVESTSSIYYRHHYHYGKELML